MNFRKAIAGIVTAAMALCCIGTIPIHSHAINVSVLLGDANGSGDVTGIDAYYISKYLAGDYFPTSYQLTAMDINKDGVIDESDSGLILHKISSGQSFNQCIRPLYDLPEDSTTTYAKHNCSSTNNYQFTTYTITGTMPALTYTDTYTDSLPSTEPEISSIESTKSLPDNVYLDNSDYECIMLKKGNSFSGSGFVLGSHIVCTAAHCVFNSNGFANNLKVVYDYDENGNEISTNVTQIHIPYDYAYLFLVLNQNSGQRRSNNDYALLYVEDDLSDYIADVGVVTSYFLDTTTLSNRELTAVGFANSYGQGIKKYYSKGDAFNFPYSSPERPYRYGANNVVVLGQSGGMQFFNSYYTTNINTNIYNKSIIGNLTDTSGIDSFGMRITPRLLRFYFQNTNLS